MQQYAVRSGQNIYDIALTLYGSVEGIFDLLVSNDWLNMETRLSYGMTLNYHEDFVINQSIVTWLDSNNILVKNGDYSHGYTDMRELAVQHISNEHQDIYATTDDMSPDEKNMFWEQFYTPRMIIDQQGQLSTISASLKSATHMFIDWGDYSDCQIVEGKDYREIEHYYKNDGRHTITLYGDFECQTLDLRDCNGTPYPLGNIYVKEYLSKAKDNDLKKLIIPNEKR